MSVNACHATCCDVGEEHCERLCCAAAATAGVSGDVINQARKAGIPFTTILALIMQYGPQVFAILQQIISGFKPQPTPTPTP